MAVQTADKFMCRAWCRVLDRAYWTPPPPLLAYTYPPPNLSLPSPREILS